MPKFKCVDSQSIFGGLSGIAMQGNCRQVEKDEAEDAPLTQGLCRKFLNGLIVDLQGSSPTFGMQVTLRGAGVELGGGGVCSLRQISAMVRELGHLYMSYNDKILKG